MKVPIYISFDSMRKEFSFEREVKNLYCRSMPYFYKGFRKSVSKDSIYSTFYLLKLFTQMYFTYAKKNQIP